MTHSHTISRTQSRLASPERYLFTLGDLSSLLPGHSLAAFKTLVSRLAADGTLERVCKGLYLYPGVSYPGNLVLYHAVALERGRRFSFVRVDHPDVTIASDQHGTGKKGRFLAHRMPEVG